MAVSINIQNEYFMSHKVSLVKILQASVRGRLADAFDIPTKSRHLELIMLLSEGVNRLLSE